MPDHYVPKPPRDEILIRTMASLAAAISLLERTRTARLAAASDKMFDQMLTDYRKALHDAREHLEGPDQTPSTLPPGVVVQFQAGRNLDGLRFIAGRYRIIKLSDKDD
ncbi:MAG: hypothetical protein JWN75_1208 [Candidatus Saccharibacteria bacterium]|nr:hypothetical protein [Candidatus Saccharibacteria bacterium]